MILQSVQPASKKLPTTSWRPKFNLLLVIKSYKVSFLSTQAWITKFKINRDVYISYLVFCYMIDLNPNSLNPNVLKVTEQLLTLTISCSRVI